jgi:hypothetical protein
MVPSRVIRIDEEVWAELQRKAVPFEDNPNSVLRRVLGLEKNEPVRDNTREDKMDSRLIKLVNMVGQSDGRNLTIRANKSGYFGISSDNDRVFGHIYTQRKRLKVEIRKDWAEKIGRKDWEHELKNGWYNTGISSVYWFIPNDSEDAYHGVARLIKALRQLRT